MILSQIPNPRLTLRQVFDHVKAHLMEQGCQSMDPEGVRCLYRHRPKADGPMLACAVGCLIPDELYNIGMENLIATQAWVLRALVEVVEDLQPLREQIALAAPRFSFLPPIYATSYADKSLSALRLLRALQTIHDRHETWKERLLEDDLAKIEKEFFSKRRRKVK